jgi:hypothetical protein
MRTFLVVSAPSITSHEACLPQNTTTRIARVPAQTLGRHASHLRLSPSKNTGEALFFFSHPSPHPSDAVQQPDLWHTSLTTLTSASLPSFVPIKMAIGTKAVKTLLVTSCCFAGDVSLPRPMPSRTQAMSSSCLATKSWLQPSRPRLYASPPASSRSSIPPLLLQLQLLWKSSRRLR